MKILIADDDPDILQCIEDMLHDAFQNLDIVKASNGAQALHLCSEQTFDLICTDFRMPVMNGLEFIQFLRREEGLNQQGPIIFISGYLELFRVDAELFSNVFFVEKPVHLDHLQRTASLALKAPLLRKVL